MKKKIYIFLVVFLIIITIILSIATKKTNNTPVQVQVTDVPDDQEIQQQANESIKDQDYAKALQEINTEYPWYSKLPIENNEFRIIYDFDKKSFRIRLLDESTDIIKQKALNSLKGIGVDLNKFDHYFIEP